MAKTKPKTIQEMEQALSPEGLKLAKREARAIRASANSCAATARSPERKAIHELVMAYIDNWR